MNKIYGKERIRITKTKENYMKKKEQYIDESNLGKNNRTQFMRAQRKERYQFLTNNVK